MSGGRGTRDPIRGALIAAAREWSAAYSKAERHKQRMAAQGSVKDLHDAIAAQQVLEDEFDQCFALRRQPDFAAALARVLREADGRDRQ